ncbi:MAG: hypothetical protein ACXACC_03450 [Promethearchaeota archaeon]|jgi:hypothetical protein
MPYNIAFDVAHKPRGKLDENLNELRDFLNANEFICYNYLETPVTQLSLRPFDILVFVCPDFAKISSMEITEIVNWVKEDGGGLLLLSHAGGDKGRNSNLSELSQQFGMAFENDQVLDETYNLGIENMPIITSFIPPHPITSGINSLCFRSGCSLTVLGSAFSIASSNDTSEPFSTPIICVSEVEMGRVCTIGSYEMFRDKVGGGFGYEDHPNLVYNLFNWLISDYRMDLRSKGQIPVIAPQTEISSVQSPDYVSETVDSATSDNTPLDIDFSLKITRKEELIELLKIFQNQINRIQSTIDKLIISLGGSSNLADGIIKSNLPPPPDTTEKKPKVEQDLGILEPSKEMTLTELPPKPSQLKENAEDVFIGLPVEEKVDLKPAPKLKSKKKLKKKDLKTERDALESKLNSVHNLLDFIEKKHKAGTIDKKDYDKRINQLRADIKKTKERIDAINNLL